MAISSRLALGILRLGIVVASLAQLLRYFMKRDLSQGRQFSHKVNARYSPFLHKFYYLQQFLMLRSRDFFLSKLATQKLITLGGELGNKAVYFFQQLFFAIGR